ncbi:MAG: alpha/beta fold hydrolase [Flavobacteriaceae bacterium]|nr:alpha/beta fold hydrolase [Flavobacteriaceae bacterium]
MSDLHYIDIDNYTTQSGTTISIPLSYQLFGQALFEAPIVLVNHALTGNSEVAGSTGWWKELIGRDKCIDTDYYTIIAFNIPGNGFDGKEASLIHNYKDFVARDVAHIFALGLQKLKIENLFAVIGGSVGGGIAWELAALKPDLIEHLIPVATDWKSTDWLIANCFLQDNILNNSVNPIEDARIHAMLCYRTSQSFKAKFDRTVNEDLGMFNIESWLTHHGDKLRNRFQLSSYKFINQLLKTIDISRSEDFETVVNRIKSAIHLVAVDTDLFFTPDESQATYSKLKENGNTVFYHEIQSIHGHDAFLIEYDQLTAYLEPIFSTYKVNVIS